ncbi:DNA-binding protein YbiB [Accumulibacter sp.]|uniref:DNA-binding protein YbiB n=1 Tax=Accumulibacter sp. TaxID=2053492 RepID=UPI0025F01964|nr:DNA-binding protein YbiB [Accumulibacter sp.]MCM8594981.1 DNA-binding protein YbiB [Accumulibacter sp.]MDS4049127.1 DNA-binding protein YbiB [Accumulibacter sp.]
MDLARVIREIGRGATGARDLSQQEAQQLYGALLDGEVPDVEQGAIAIALRMKTETADELIGFLAAAHQRLPGLLRPPGRPWPVVIPSYNGARRHANLTPLLALLLARQGLPVLVHGLPDDYGRVTSERIFREYGVVPCASLADAERRLECGDVAYLPLPLLSPGLDRQIALRRRLGLRNSAHSLVKMLDPFRGESLLVAAATHPDYIAIMREVLTRTRARALLLRGSEGEPFANPRRRPAIEYVHDGTSEIACTAERDSVGTSPALPESCDASTTVGWMHRVLSAELPVPPPIASQIACCRFASGLAETAEEALARVVGSDVRPPGGSSAASG